MSNLFNSSNKVKNVALIFLGSLILVACFFLLGGKEVVNSAFNGSTEYLKQDKILDLSSNLNDTKIYNPCTSCDNPEYDEKIANIVSKESVAELLNKLKDAKKVKAGKTGLGLNPLKVKLNYNGDKSVEIIVISEDKVVINFAVGVGEVVPTVYELKKGTNIKTYITNMYNKNISIVDEKEVIGSEQILKMSTNLSDTKIYNPCTSCDNPEYDEKIANIVSTNSIKELLSKLKDAKKVNVGAIGLGFNPLKAIVNYNGNPSVEIIVISEDKVAINFAVGVGEVLPSVYELKKGSNIKTFIINMYNNNISKEEVISTTKILELSTNLSNAKIYNPCTSCESPKYNEKIANIVNTNSIKELLNKLKDAKKIKVGEIGLGFNPLKAIVNYNGNPSVEIIVISEDKVAINFAVGVGEASPTVYELTKGTNIKTFITNMYNNNINKEEIISATKILELSTNLSNVKIYNPCASCDNPEYDEKIANVVSTNSIKELLNKLKNAKKVNVGAIGLGFNPLKAIVNYNGNPSVEIIVLSEDKVAINFAVGVGEVSPAVYELTKGTNIKTYITNMYNNNINKEEVISATKILELSTNLSNVKIYNPCTICDGPEYEEKIANIVSENSIKELLNKLKDARKINVGEIGLGNNPLKAIVNYNENPSVEIIVLSEDKVAINFAVGLGEVSPAVYELTKGTNIKTFITNMYNNN